MMRRIPIFCYAILVLGFPFTPASAQGCCSIPTPPIVIGSGAANFGIYSKGQFLMGLSYGFTNISRAIQETKKVTDPENRATNIQITNFEAAYDITNRFRLNLSVSLVAKTRTISLRDIDNQPLAAKFSSAGVGDISIVGHYAIETFSFIRGREVTIGAGVKFPTGSTNKLQNNARLPIDLQPGTGSYGAILNGSYFQGSAPSRLSYFANATILVNGQNPDGYKMGHELIYSFGLGRAVLLPFAGIFVELKGRYATKDHFNGRMLPSTGGSLVYLAPDIIIRRFKRLSAILTIDVPIFQRVNGLQVTPAIGFSTLLVYALDKHR